MIRMILVALLSTVLLTPSSVRRDSGLPDALAHLPRLMLWAWERPEDLRFIDPETTGVAYLAGTIQLEGRSVSVRPRLNPLRVPPATTLMAVVRIETSRLERPLLDSSQLNQTVDELKWLFSRQGLAAVQIDFDAVVSERDFYRRLLRQLRPEISPQLGLSITALASWCLEDPWIADLPVDEAVPMLFRMGRDSDSVRRHLGNGSDFSRAVARLSVGLSTDEPGVTFPAYRRIYLFHPTAWNSSAVKENLWLIE